MQAWLNDRFSILFNRLSALQQDAGFSIEVCLKGNLQPSSSFFSLLRNFAYFCTFFDQLTPDCFCVSRSYLYSLLKTYVIFLLFLWRRMILPTFCYLDFSFFRKAFLCHCKIIFLYYFNSVLGVPCWSKMFLRSDFTLLESLAWSGNSTWEGKKTSKKDKRCRQVFPLNSISRFLISSKSIW